MTVKCPGKLALALALLLSIPLAAEEGFYVGSVRNLSFEGDAPTAAELERIPMSWRTNRDSIHLESGEVLLFNANSFRTNNADWNNFDGLTLAARGESGKVRGALVIPGEDGGAKRHAFEVRLAAGTDSQRRAFWTSWRSHYSRLLSMDRPGGAWFRHQVRRAEAALGVKSNERARNRRFFGGRASSAESTFALMSGGRAVSENLQLDREMPIQGVGADTVDINTISGVTVREFDWTDLNKGLSPARDPLAALIPSDQHAVFLPSFKAMVALADNADEHGTPLLQMAEPRSEDAMVRERYEKQLCLSLNSVARVIGPQLIDSLALTGGDAYLRTGSDVALLMETSQPKALQKFIEAQQALTAGRTNAARIQGDIEGVRYSGYRSTTRDISTHVALVGDSVVVTNSITQLGRIVATARNQNRSLADTPEYTFFRNRYPLGNENETGLVILSDETIRRWCGPKWRIAASRRTRVAAAMAEVQASHMNDLVMGQVEAQKVASNFAVAPGEEFTLSSDRINSEAYGDLTFQTPIMELELLRVSNEEARMYRRWRDGYQRNWSNYFDPIAVRFEVNEQRVSADVTVMPLIDQSRYNQLIEVSKGAELSGAVGDPHPEALMQWSLALNPDSNMLKGYTNILTAMAPQIRVDPLSWVGNGVSVYIDRDPLLAKAAKAEDPEQFLEDNIHNFPVALHVEVRDGLKLALFMTGLRAFIEQTVPGMSTWESLKHNGEPYVKVRATERSGLPRNDDFSLYYAASGEGLTFTLSEHVMHNVLERRVARREAKAKGEDLADHDVRWDGQQVSMRVSREGLSLFQELFGRSYQEQLRSLAYSNITVLNEWKRLFPELDPVEVHEKFWQRRLYCPGGGKYVWNEKLNTVESTVYGSPTSRKEGGPNFPKSLRQFTDGEFGLTFEEHGLRARMVMDRQP